MQIKITLIFHFKLTRIAAIKQKNPQTHRHFHGYRKIVKKKTVDLIHSCLRKQFSISQINKVAI